MFTTTASRTRDPSARCLRGLRRAGGHALRRRRGVDPRPDRRGLNDLDYTVLTASDGAAGLEVIQSGVNVDLLIADVGLPNGLNGRQAADAARVIRPDMKVLLITGYAGNAAVGTGYLEHGMALSTKPFTLTALSVKVSEMSKAAVWQRRPQIRPASCRRRRTARRR